MRRARIPIGLDSGRLTLTFTPSEALGTEIVEWCLLGRGGNPYHERDRVNLAIEPYQVGNARGVASIRHGIETYFKSLSNQGKARLIKISTETPPGSGETKIVVEYLDLASGTQRRATI